MCVCVCVCVCVFMCVCVCVCVYSRKIIFCCFFPQQKKFLEYGEFQNNLYGTRSVCVYVCLCKINSFSASSDDGFFLLSFSLQSIVDVIDSGKVCVLDAMPKVKRKGAIDVAVWKKEKGERERER